MPDKALYPVMVYIHSGDFSSGTSQAQPGHVLALQNVVVVTFNYRLGALGKSEAKKALYILASSSQVIATQFVMLTIFYDSNFTEF